MKTRFTLIFCLLAAILPFGLKAQQLEQLDMGVSGFSFDTYLTGINNKGYVTGYFNNGSNNIGFIISQSGKRLTVDNVGLGYTDSKAEGINDNNVAVITCNNGSAVGIYRAYIDTLGDSIHHYVQVSGLVQPSSVAFDISNNNDISGWFQSTYRYLWVKHDSIIPGGNSAYESEVFQTSGPTYYNTMAGGINDANKVAGFYIDGVNINPVIYDNITHTFNALSTAFRIRLWDINNNNWVAGEFRQTTNNVYMAFIADVSTGSFTSFTSLASIFDTNIIQSVANGINDQGEVVGAFLHPGTNKWTGFIYHPNDTAFQLPGFNFMQHTWSMKNTSTGNGSNPIWTANYWGGSNYTSYDAYANSNDPVFDQPSFTQFNFSPPVGDSLSVSWKGFASEVDFMGIGTSSLPAHQYAYNTIFKANFRTRWVGSGLSWGFVGYCYGFSYATLLHLYEDTIFSNWFNVPLGINSYGIQNTDEPVVRAIERCYEKQMDAGTKALYHFVHYQNVGLWQGLYYLKNTYRKSMAETDPKAVALRYNDNTYHSVLPYKIKTPRTLPTDHPTIDYDTVFIYDSNYPGDMNQFLTVNSSQYYNAHDSVHSPVYGNLDKISFNKPGVRFVMNKQFSDMKSTAGVSYEQYANFAFFGDPYYTATSTNSQASVNGSGYQYNNITTDFFPHDAEDTAHNLTYAHTMDTNTTVNISTYNYADSVMSWSQTNKSRTMALYRQALPGETDHSTQRNRLMTYGNPDNVTKYLNAELVEITDDISQGTRIQIAGICAAPGDSIVTESPSAFVYKIKKVAGTTSCTYNITTHTLYNGDSVLEGHGDIVLDPNSTHIIDPYFNGGTDVVVQVDNGNDGSVDNTITVVDWPVGVKNVIAQNGIKIYPNPAHDELTLEVSKSDTYNIQIMDVVGRTVYNNKIIIGGKVQIPMVQYAPGVYLIQVSDSRGTAILKDKVIKQ